LNKFAQEVEAILAASTYSNDVEGELLEDTAKFSIVVLDPEGENFLRGVAEIFNYLLIKLI